MIKKLLGIAVVISLLTSCFTVYADDAELSEEINESFGLAIMPEERIKAFNDSLPYISRVKLNTLATERLNSSEEDIQISAMLNSVDTEAVDIGDEITYRYPGSSGAGSGAAVINDLPREVDNTQLMSFPEIGDQGDYGSCVAWSVCYYQLTNNTCLVRGLNARNSRGNIYENVFNPLWTYTLTNGGSNYSVGTYYDEALASIMSFGAPTYADLSTSFTINSIERWNTDGDVWEQAMKNKPAQIATAEINTSDTVSADDPEMNKLKSLLANGYVVTIPVIYDSFIFTTSTTDYSYGCRYAKNMSSNDSSHALTIVGYDDRYWIDVNGNKRKNDDEYGAFKIANSWGMNGLNCDEGCFWLSYDALGEKSKILDNFAIDRMPAFTNYYFIQPTKEYVPLLTADVEITASDRNQIGVSIGVSDVDDIVPDEEISVTNDYYIAFGENNKSFLSYYGDISIPKRRFGGSTSLRDDTVTIPFDITPVIKKAYSETGMGEDKKVKIYVTLKDNLDDGYSSKLNNVTVGETMTGENFYCPDTQPMIANNSSVTKTVICDLSTLVDIYSKQELEITFNSNVLPVSVTNQNIYLTDSDNTKIDLDFNINQNEITAYFPEALLGKNIYGNAYLLFIGEDITSLGGNKLGESKTVPLYILGKYFEWKNPRPY